MQALPVRLHPIEKGGLEALIRRFFHTIGQLAELSSIFLRAASNHVA
jgi:hypothetical protein